MKEVKKAIKDAFSFGGGLNTTQEMKINAIVLNSKPDIKSGAFITW